MTTSPTKTLPDADPWYRDNRWLMGAVPFVLLFIGWWLLTSANFQLMRYVLPPPGEVWDALVKDMTSGVMLKHAWITFTELIGGLGIAVVSATILGVLIGRSPLLEKLLYPMIVFFQAIPKVALAPLWLIVFGFGIGSKIAIAAMVSFFPMLIGTIVGMSAMRNDEHELMRSLRATSWQTFVKVQLPRALPSIFGGLQVAAIFALLGAVVGEFIGARGGLGYLISFRSAQLDLPGVFSPIVVLALFGVVLDLGLQAIGKRFMAWEGE